jgi:hypothetical protein
MEKVYPKMNLSVYQMAFTTPPIAVKKPLQRRFLSAFRNYDRGIRTPNLNFDLCVSDHNSFTMYVPPSSRLSGLYPHFSYKLIPSGL